MESENFKNAEDNFKRYKENVADLTQEFELGLFLYLLNKVKWYALLIISITRPVSIFITVTGTD